MSALLLRNTDWVDVLYFNVKYNLKSDRCADTDVVSVISDGGPAGVQNDDP